MTESTSRSGSLQDADEACTKSYRDLERELDFRTRELTFAQDRYRLLLESITDYVYTVKVTDGHVTTTEHGMGAIAVTGFHPREFADDPMLWIQMVHPDDRELVTEQGRRVLAGQAPRTLEHRIVKKDGNHRWVKSTTVPKYDANGNLIGYDGIVSDITDRKRSELALRETQEEQQKAGQFLTTILNHTFVAAIYLDTEFNYLWVNEAYAKACARPAAFFPGKNLFALYPQIAPRALFLKAATSTEPLLGSALAISFPDQPERGTTYWDYSLYPIGDKSGTVVGLVLTMAEVTTRIAVEAQLRSSETRYRTVANYTYDWEYWETPDGHLAYCSPACLRITGHLPEEYLRQPRLLEELIVSDDRARWHSYRDDLLNSHAAQEVDFRIYKPNGQVCWLSQRCASVITDDGTHLGWRASTRDITDRKQAELQLLTQAELLNLAPVSITVHDEDGHFSYANQAALDLHGFTKEEFFALTAGELDAPDDSTRAADWVERLNATQRFSGTVRHRRKDGSKIALWTVAQLAQRDSHQLVLCAAADTTEHERDAQALADSASALSALFEAVNHPVLLIELDGTVVACNGVAAAEFGKRRSELEGTKIYSQLAEDVTVRRTQLIDQVIQTGMPSRFVSSRDGRLLQHTIYPVTGKEGTVTRLAIFLEDTTERQRLQEQAHQSAKLDAMSRLAGGVAHDLNNLLMPILSYSESALENELGVEAMREYLLEIRSAGLQAKDLVQQLNSFGRRQNVEFQPIDLNELVVGFVGILSRALKEDIRVKITPSPCPLWILADSGQLELVFMNLAMRAQQAMPQGGTVTFALSASRPVCDGVLADGTIPTEVRLTVADDGIGMDAATRERLFEPSFAVKTAAKGTGLGLASVHALVEQHQGTISVTSEPGHGTEFVIRFPLVPEPLRPLAASAAPAPMYTRSARGESVLVVEDNALVRDLAVRALEAQGYRVRAFASAQSCLSSVGDWEEPFALLLTDLSMPDMSGKALYEILSKRYEALKVIYMSGYSREYVSERHGIGRDSAFLHKPFAMRRLLTVIGQLLDDIPPVSLA